MQKPFYKEQGADKVFNWMVLTIIILFAFLFMYPLYFIVIASISNPDMVNAGQTLLWPRGITTEGFRYVLGEKRIWNGYRNTILYAFNGMLLGVALTIPAAYALSRKDMLGRGLIMKIMVFTMFFSGGLIPTYLVVKSLSLINTRWVLIIMGSFSVYNLIISRTFFEVNIPIELQEAAEIDGCSIPRFFVSVVLPLSKAIVAIIVLYYTVAHWNSYYNALVYTTKMELEPLQLVLRSFLVRGDQLSIDSGLDAEAINAMLERAGQMRYAIIIVSSVPILCAYPFVQRYFVQGIMIGSVKG